MDTALQGFEVLGRIGSTCVYYRLAGHQDLDYELKLTITDFRGEAWMSRFSLQSFLESDCLAGYEPDLDELLRWIIASLNDPAKATLSREAGGKILSLQAEHKVPAMTAPLRLQYPPLGACGKVAGSAAFDEMRDLAGALYTSFIEANTATQRLQEVCSSQQEEMRSLEANYSRVQGKLQELHPGMVLSANGSFKRRGDSSSLGGIDKKVQLEAPPTQSSPETAAPPESPQPAPRIGAAKVVPRRGRGRAIPGFTARIRR